MLNVKPPTRDQIALAIASAPDNSTESIAKALANLANDAAIIARREEDEFQAALAGMKSRYTPIRQNMSLSTAANIDEVTDTLVREHAQAVEAKIAQNKQLISGIAASVLAVGSAVATGGMTSPMAITSLTGIASQVSSALAS